MKKIMFFLVLACGISAGAYQTFAFQDPNSLEAQNKPNVGAKQTEAVFADKDAENARINSPITEEECQRYREDRQVLRDPTLNPNQGPIEVRPMSDRERACLDQERARIEKQNRQADTSRQCMKIRSSIAHDLARIAACDEAIFRTAARCQEAIAHFNQACRNFFTPCASPTSSERMRLTQACVSYDTLPECQGVPSLKEIEIRGTPIECD